MGMVAILVMWSKPFEQLFFPKSPGGCIWNVVAIGPIVTEEKSFENLGRMDDGPCLYYKLPRSLRLRWAKKPCHGSSTFFMDWFWYNKCDIIWDKCVFRHCRSKVIVTDAILEKLCHASSAFLWTDFDYTSQKC